MCSVGVGVFHIIQQARSSSAPCLLVYLMCLSGIFPAQQEELIAKARETEKTAKARLAEIQQNMKVWCGVVCISCVCTCRVMSECM